MGLHRSCLLGLVALTAVAEPVFSAGASTSYTIDVGGVPPLGVTRQEFTRENCDGSFTSSKLNGLDGYVVDVSRWQGQTLPIFWGGPATAGAGLTGELFTARCQATPNPSLYSPTPGWWRVTVPIGSNWLVVQPNNAVDVTFTMP
jgi:hypothetical protein